MLELTGAKRRIVERLRRDDGASAGDLAAAFGLTDTAVRQHLDALLADGVVRRGTGVRTDGRRGRPPATWHLTERARSAFPDRHGDLTVDLLDAVRHRLGESALGDVLATRAARQIRSYRESLDGSSVPVRLARLAERRTAEGYEAEVVRDGAAYRFVEHHCPIRTAAESCGELCTSELDVFRASLGDDVEVHREDHVLRGDTRCAYRVVPVNSRIRGQKRSASGGGSVLGPT